MPNLYLKKLLGSEMCRMVIDVYGHFPSFHSRKYSDKYGNVVAGTAI